MSLNRNAGPTFAVALLVVALSGIGRTEALRSRVLPFDLRGTTDIVVPVMIDGRGPFRFLLDTGSSRTIVLARLAKSLGLTSFGTATLITPTGRAGRPLSLVRRLEVGAAPPSNVVAMVVADDDLAPADNVDGVVGQDVLGSLTYTIDYVSRHIVWHLTLPRELSGQRLSLRRSNRGVLVALPQPSARDLHFVPDSGADGWVFFSDGDVPSSTKWSSAAFVRSITGAREAAAIVVDELRVGGITLRNQRGVVIKPDLGDEAIADGLLPLHLFARVTFNPRGQELIVEER